MIRRNTWIILAIFVVLLGGLLYLQKNPLPVSNANKTPSPTAMISLLPETVASQMKEITITQDGKKIILQQDEQGNWNAIADPEEAISSDIALQFISVLKEVNILQYLSSQPDTTSTGLSAPKAEIVISDGSKTLTTIRIGNPTPTDSGYYVQFGSDSPIVAPKYSIDPLLTTFSKTGTTTPTP